MKFKLVIALIPAVLFYASSCQQRIGSAALKTEHDTVSYLIGHSIGASLAASPMTEFNTAAILEGLQDGIDGDDSFMDPNSANAMIGTYMQALEDAESVIYLEEGIAFLENNKTRAEVTTTESGLQYEILVEGTGPKPADTDNVTVHYHGTLIDGTIFDSSVDRGEPASFPVGGVIPGWVEALQLMPVGSKWKLFIPTELAYGSSPRPGGAIKPNMALIFEVELISINQ
jgi:FKBP-type peptidyl-prolyl cis-trans isomerase FklB